MVATSFNLCTTVLASKLDKALLLPWESAFMAGSTDLEEGWIASQHLCPIDDGAGLCRCSP